MHLVILESCKILLKGGGCCVELARHHYRACVDHCRFRSFTGLVVHVYRGLERNCSDPADPIGCRGAHLFHQWDQIEVILGKGEAFFPSGREEGLRNQSISIVKHFRKADLSFLLKSAFFSSYRGSMWATTSSLFLLKLIVHTKWYPDGRVRAHPWRFSGPSFGKRGAIQL